MAEEERPKHYVYDHETGEEVATPVSDEEWDEIKRKQVEADAEWAAARAKEEADAAQAEADRQTLLNHPDPAIQALARRAGIVPEGG